MLTSETKTELNVYYTKANKWIKLELKLYYTDANKWTKTELKYYTNAKKWIKHEYTDANKRSYLLEKRTEYQTLTGTWIKQNLNINHQTKRHTSNVNINQMKFQHKSTQKEEIKLLRP